MTSFRQIEANRRNARLSTGPITEEGKKKSRRNALRHGLTAETVIAALEDADDYAAFELAVTAGYHATSTIERELILRLASLLWRLRRATAIESGLFKIQAKQLLQFRRPPRQKHRKAIKDVDSAAQHELDAMIDRNANLTSISEAPGHFEEVTIAYVRLTNLPTYPLDRLCRYEATLWRQAYQIMFALRCFRRQGL